MKRFNPSKFIIVLISVIVLSLYVFLPTFRLALTGDDYLGLWRLFYHINGYSSKQWSLFTFFFTDYGPQDVLTYLIYHFSGLNGFWYYFTAYLLRLLASLSVYILLKFLTRDSKISVLGSLFFIVSSTGLEVNDWSFNMPSFVSITFISFHIILLLSYLSNHKFITFLFSILFMILAILSQPIRSSFLPAFTIMTIVIGAFFDKDKHYFKYIISVLIVLLSFYTLIVTTQIGSVFGISAEFIDRLTFDWFSSGGGSFSLISKLITQKEFGFVIFPFGQIGSIILPLKMLPFTSLQLTVHSQIVIGSIIFFIFTSLSEFVLYKLIRINSFKLASRVTAILNLVWIILVMTYYLQYKYYPINMNEFVYLAYGGFFTILVLNLAIQANRHTRLLIVISYLGLVLSFFAPWIRNPLSIHVTTSRYLIIPMFYAVMLFGVILTMFKNKCIGLLLFLILILVNIYTSRKYISGLSYVRDNNLVMSIRNKLPYNKKFEDSDTPLVYYFETDDTELLHHSIMFGFPAIISIQYDFHNPWHIAYTTNWTEVTNAYKDGSGLKRFGTIPIKKVDLEDIHSFKLESGKLTETTEETHKKLMNESF